MIENCSFLFVTFACGIEHETVGTADACALIPKHLPVVDFLEETGENIFIIVWIDHRIDEPKFVIGHDLGVITIAVDAAALFTLRTGEDEVIAAELAVCRLKHLCQ